MIGIHQERIKKVELMLKEIYVVRKPESHLDETYNSAKMSIKQREPDAPSGNRLEKSHGKQSKFNKLTIIRKKQMGNSSELPSSLVPAIQCVECRDLFPQIDFFYTNKTGLCIDCWERKEV